METVTLAQEQYHASVFRSVLWKERVKGEVIFSCLGEWCFELIIVALSSTTENSQAFQFLV